MIEKKLMQLKERIESTKAEKARAEGALQQLEERLKSEFGVNTETAAEKLLEKLQKEAAELESQVQKAIQDMEDKYGI